MKSVKTNLETLIKMDMKYSQKEKVIVEKIKRIRDKNFISKNYVTSKLEIKEN